MAIARWPVGEDERGMGTSQTLANQNIWANEWKYFSKVHFIFICWTAVCWILITSSLKLIINWKMGCVKQFNWSVCEWHIFMCVNDVWIAPVLYCVPMQWPYTCYTSRCRLLRLAVSEYDDTWHKHQPHIHYIKGISKEVHLIKYN